MAELSQIMYFNLNKDGDSAIVRLCHTSVKTIESATIHNITVNEKKRSIKCIGENCPICASGKEPFKRIYIHLFDYADNKEKVWARTDKIIAQLESIENDWGDLSNCVLKITRSGDNFPKYEVNIMPPTNYAPIDKEIIDKSIAYRFYMSRKQEEIEEFLAKGSFPVRNKEQKQEYVPKSEYKKEVKQSAVSTPSTKVEPADVDTDDFDPFNIIPRRV